MKRRTFISLLAAVPLLVLNQQPKADDFITKIYTDYFRTHRQPPAVISVHPDLFKEYMAGMRTLYREGTHINVSTQPRLVFKTCIVKSESCFKGKYDWMAGSKDWK